jgi:PAS domain S-box-containing protein
MTHMDVLDIPIKTHILFQRYRTVMLFAIIGSIIFLLMTIFSVQSHMKFARQVFLRDIEEDIRHEKLIHIFDMANINNIQSLGSIISDDLDVIVSRVKDDFHIKQLNIINNEGIVVWSTNRATVGKNNSRNSLFQQAIHGIVASKYKSNTTFGDFPQQIPLVESYTPLKNDHGEVIGVVEIYTDISDHLPLFHEEKKLVVKTTLITLGLFFLPLLLMALVVDELKYRSTKADREAERKLRQSEAWYRSILQDATVGIWIFEGKSLRYTNNTCAQMFGYASAEEMLEAGRTDFWAAFIHPQYHARLQERAARAQKGETPPLSPYWEGIRKDGGRFWLQSTGQHITWEGRPAVLSFLADVTERKTAEDALQESERRFRSVTQLAHDAIISADARGVILTWNRGARTIFGYTEEEIVGQPLLRLIPERYRDAHQRELARLQVTGASQVQGKTVELVGLRKDGSEFPLELSLTAWQAPQGPCYSGIIRDITERKQWQAQLQQAQKMEAIGTLSGGIAHNFNNLLAIIIGYTELATADLSSTSPSRQYLQEVLTASNRARDLVQQILTFSRKSNAGRGPVHLPPLVKETLKLLRASLPATIEIRQHIDRQVGVVLADPTQMHQVLMNLCTNAEYAMRATGGVLEVRLEAVDLDEAFAAAHPEVKPGAYVRLTVQDTGCGIEPEVVGRIFEPFFTTKEVGEGTGMGLAVVHGIVTECGGTITVHSTPGKGTRFQIYLPCVPETVQDTTPVEERVPHGQGCILFVDDEPVLAQWGRTLLERLGYKVVARTSSVEALEAFRAMPQRFDLVITDQTMPNITGDALARELRRLRPEVPIILCTGFSHLVDADKARALGIDAMCMKPLAARDLAVTIQQVLRTRAKVLTPPGRIHQQTE